MQVKKVMNSVYQSLREEFEAEENYTGAEVMAVVLAAIKVHLHSTQVHLNMTALCDNYANLHTSWSEITDEGELVSLLTFRDCIAKPHSETA